MARKFKRFLRFATVRVAEAIIVLVLFLALLWAFSALSELLAEPINNALWGAWEAVNAAL